MTGVFYKRKEAGGGKRSQMRELRRDEGNGERTHERSTRTNSLDRRLRTLDLVLESLSAFVGDDEGCRLV